MYAAETGSHLLAAPRNGGFEAFRRQFDEPECRQRLAERSLRFVARSEASYPGRLRSVHDPPIGLFVRGNGELELLDQPCVAVVGARACSSYGTEVAVTLGRDLARAGVVVVSGLARGVDGAAHRGALEAGTTVAVLGCGIDRDYPSAHAALAGLIAARGLIVSEYAPGVEPAPWRFPARNRIVAGLADATVVVEARARSGALITADLALEEGREVLAVPGEITSSLSAGTNELLRLGAIPVTSAADVLAVLGIEPAPPPAAVPKESLSPAAQALAAAVGDRPLTFDELIHRSGLEPSVVSATLVELELLGLVRESDGVYRGVMPPA
jgi:DNA processing protein